INRMAIDDHCASAARAAVANFFCPGQVEPVAERIEQGDARLDVEAPVLAVDLEADWDFAGAGKPRLSARRRFERSRGKQTRRDRAHADAFKESASRQAAGFGSVC